MTTTDEVKAAMEFDAEYWLTAKANAADAEPVEPGDFAFDQRSEATRYRRAALQLTTLRTQLATANAETARLGRELEEASRRFQLETLRISEYARVVDRFIADHGPPHVVERECCRLVREAMKLRARSINDAEANNTLNRIDRLRALVNGMTKDRGARGWFSPETHQLQIACDTHHDLTGGASDALRAQADAPTKEGAD